MKFELNYDSVSLLQELFEEVKKATLSIFSNFKPFGYEF